MSGGNKRSSLRRSRRATKKSSQYSVGDIVEIPRGSQLIKGRLAQLLTEGTSPNPRWLVKFDGQPYKDEEVYEHVFRDTNEDASEDSSEHHHQQQHHHRRATAETSSGSKQSSKKTREVEAPSEPALDKLLVAVATATATTTLPNTSSSPPTAQASEDSSINNTNGTGTDSAKVSAREQRSRRRQAIIDVVEIPVTKTGMTTTANSSSNNNKRQRPVNHHHHAPVKKGNSNNSKRPRTETSNTNGASDQECLKIKLLTGTLFLYRGRHRRAEFVRRV